MLTVTDEFEETCTYVLEVVLKQCSGSCWGVYNDVLKQKLPLYLAYSAILESIAETVAKTNLYPRCLVTCYEASALLALKHTPIQIRVTW